MRLEGDEAAEGGDAGMTDADTAARIYTTEGLLPRGQQRLRLTRSCGDDINNRAASALHCVSSRTQWPQVRAFLHLPAHHLLRASAPIPHWMSIL